MAGWRRSGMTEEQLQQYCKRIGGDKAVQQSALHKQADMTLLRSICTLHLQSVPFENLNLMYEPAKRQSNGTIKNDLDSLIQKIVVQKRGGYCFEANEILAQALTSMGFDLHTAAGRIVSADGHRTFPGEIVLSKIEHQLVLVRMDGQIWICDVGQGSATPLEPVLLTEELLQGDQLSGKGGMHRVRRGLLGVENDPTFVKPRMPHREGWYMQKYSAKRDKWQDIYFFTEQEWRTEDYEPPNLYCSHNHSVFNHHLIVALHTRKGRKTISDSKLRIYEGDNVQESQLDTYEALQSALQEHFGLAV